MCVFRDQVRLGVGLFLIWQCNLICMHVNKDWMRHKSATDPCPLWKVLIINSIVLKPMTCQHLVDKEIERWNCFELVQGCILPKHCFGVSCALTQTWVFSFSPNCTNRFVELHVLVGFLKKKKKERKKSFVNIIDRLAFMYWISRVYFYPDVKHSKTLGVTRQACHNSVDVMLMYSNGCKVCFNFYQRIRKFKRKYL